MIVKIVNNQQQLEDAFSVRKTVFIHEQHVPEAEEIDQYDDSAVHFVLYDEAQIPIGAGRLRTINEIGKVERICVLKEKRKSGAGKIIMDAIEEHARKQGIFIVKLNAQTHAIPFYRKLKYEIISDEFFDAGIPHRTMEKHL